MAILVEFLPIVAFFVTLKFTDVIIATAVAVAATLLAVIYQRVTTGRVQPMTLVSAGLMVVFGGLTIAFNDELFVKWKPTVLMTLFAVVFAASQFIGKRTIAERMLGKAFAAPAAVWARVNAGLALFFIATGAINLWVAYSFSTDTWATFKLFGLIGLNFLGFGLAVGYLMKRGTPVQPDNTAPKSDA
jgi:intracellular septation protein